MGMRKKKNRDPRVKVKNFPFGMCLTSVLAFGSFTTLQMYIIGPYIDMSRISKFHYLAANLLWILAAATLALISYIQIRRYYEKPIEEFAEATSKVASGDFSVYVPQIHTANKADYMDVIIMDFNKMVEELGSIETLKTDFFTNVSHEIKTPLSVIQNCTEALQNESLSPERRKEYLDMLQLASKRLSALITNMLKLNKLEKQVIRPVPEAYDVCAQLCDCALQYEEIWEKKNIEFDIEMEDRAMVLADEELMELVWTNLLSNAFKFTPDCGKIKVTQITDGNNITVSISDTGCGMSEETVKRIFEKFYQGDTSHATAGNGLGLALVERILQLLDGTIEVESTLGKGSTFTIILPAAGAEKGGIMK